jgi:hypothetical protein
MAVLAAAGGCRRGPDAETRRRTAGLAEALGPGFFAAALRRLGGARFHGTARFAARPQSATATADTGDTGDTGDEAVTTTTDLWLDRTGNYRMRETNDRDGGREVVLYGRELAVALRYGKMIRRAAEEPEPTRLLEEALGAPGAAWDVIAPTATVQRDGSQPGGGAKTTAYRIALAPGPATAPGQAATATDDHGDERGDGRGADRRAAGPRGWRRTVSVTALDGRVLVDDATGAVLRVDLKAAYTMRRDDRPLRGEIEVHTALSELGAVAPVERPPAEDLALRQRTVPEQRELVGGLPAAPGPAVSSRPARPALPKVTGP